MSQNRGSHTQGEFVETLERLRTKIDRLPQSHRPHLHALADTIREQYDKQRRRKDVAACDEAADDKPVTEVP